MYRLRILQALARLQEMRLVATAERLGSRFTLNISAFTPRRFRHLLASMMSLWSRQLV
jgi:hypothetical protein